MDHGADTTQKIVIGGAIFLGIVIVLTIGYSLYTKAKVAEGELANKLALDTATKKTTDVASVSLTGESKNKSGFTYDGLVQKRKDEVATTSNLEIVNENVPVEVPKEEPAPVEVVEVHVTHGTVATYANFLTTNLGRAVQDITGTAIPDKSGMGDVHLIR